MWAGDAEVVFEIGEEGDGLEGFAEALCGGRGEVVCVVACVVVPRTGYAPFRGEGYRSACCGAGRTFQLRP